MTRPHCRYCGATRRLFVPLNNPARPFCLDKRACGERRVLALLEAEAAAWKGCEAGRAAAVALAVAHVKAKARRA